MPRTIESSSRRRSIFNTIAPWVMLGAAITTEVAGTLALRGSDGFTRLVPSVVVVVGYVASFILLALVLKTLPVGIVYAIGRRSGSHWSRCWAKSCSTIPSRRSRRWAWC